MNWVASWIGFFVFFIHGQVYSKWITYIGVQKRRITISYRRTFRIKRKEFLYFCGPELSIFVELLKSILETKISFGFSSQKYSKKSETHQQSFKKYGCEFWDLQKNIHLVTPSLYAMNMGRHWPFPYVKTLQINMLFLCLTANEIMCVQFLKHTMYNTCFWPMGNHQSNLAHIIYAYTADDICDLDGHGRNVIRKDKNKRNFYS
jgi:hypothetical protein